MDTTEVRVVNGGRSKSVGSDSTTIKAIWYR